MYDSGAAPIKEAKEPEDAASLIQKIYRGFASRQAASKARDAELVFIGMRPPEARKSEDLAKTMAHARLKRKTEQAENKEMYEKALIDMRDVVMEEEGPEMREKMTQAIRDWFTEQLGQGLYPEDLEGYYAMLHAPSKEEAEALAAAEAAAAEEGGKGKKGKGEKKAEKKEGKGDKKGKKGKVGRGGVPCCVHCSVCHVCVYVYGVRMCLCLYLCVGVLCACVRVCMCSCLCVKLA